MNDPRLALAVFLSFAFAAFALTAAATEMSNNAGGADKSVAQLQPEDAPEAGPRGRMFAGVPPNLTMPTCASFSLSRQVVRTHGNGASLGESPAGWEPFAAHPSGLDEWVVLLRRCER